jgi:hypothetical protein
MKKVILLSAIAIGAIAALLVFRAREENVAALNLSWKEGDGIVTFEFRVANLTQEEAVVSVELIAERTIKLRAGPLIAEAGRKRVEVHLAAKEEKKVRGQIALDSAAVGKLSLVPHVTAKKPNQAPGQTLTAVTVPAAQEELKS